MIRTHILGASPTSLGALLVGVGAILLIADALGGPGTWGMSYGRTMLEPSRRLSYGAEVSGSILVAVGSALLLLSAKGLSVLAVVVSLILAVGLIYVVMTFRLHEHMKLLARQEGDGTVCRSWWWCARNPTWRPPEN